MKAKREIILVGDRVLVDPDTKTGRTKSGLYPPVTVQNKEKVLSGYVVRTGPGYVVPEAVTAEFRAPGEPAPVKYIPLQAVEGDYAIFLKEAAVEMEFEGKEYLIVPHSAILALVRTEIV